jgi:tRNA(fMet)-specific endonuclease VapC
MYVLDTNTVIYFFKGMGGVSRQLLARPPKEIGIPTIVIYELDVGIAKSRHSRKRREQLGEFLSAVSVLPFGYEEARCAADIRVELEKKGIPIGPYDVLIAAVALSHNATLVTHNAKEFARIKGLRVEDWYS